MISDKWNKDFREILLYLINLPFLLSCFQVKWLLPTPFEKVRRVFPELQSLAYRCL